MRQGLLMTAYLRWLGVAEAELSLWRGAGALAGVAATFAYPRLHRAAGTGTLPALIKQRPELHTACHPSTCIQVAGDTRDSSGHEFLMRGWIYSSMRRV